MRFEASRRSLAAAGFLTQAIDSTRDLFFHPAPETRSLEELTEQVAAMRGVTLPFTEPRYAMINPIVHVDGNIAVLTFNLVNYGKPSGSAEETVLARWNATEVYRKGDGTWRIIHTHWSFTQPQLSGPPAS